MNKNKKNQWEIIMCQRNKVNFLLEKKKQANKKFKEQNFAFDRRHGCSVYNEYIYVDIFKINRFRNSVFLSKTPY